MPVPKGKHMFGNVTVGEKGQIVIPKKARDIFGIKPGDDLVMLGDEEQGLAMMKTERFLEMVSSVINMPGISPDDKADISSVLLGPFDKEKNE